MSTPGYGIETHDDDMTGVPINPVEGEDYICDFVSAEVVMTKNEATGDMEPMRDEAKRGARKICVTFEIAEGECAGCKLNRKFHFGSECDKKMRDKFWSFFRTIGIEEPRTKADFDRVWPKSEDKEGVLRKAHPCDVITAQFANGEQAKITCGTFTPQVQKVDATGAQVFDDDNKPVMTDSNETYYLVGWGDYGRPPFLLKRLASDAISNDSPQQDDCPF